MDELNVMMDMYPGLASQIRQAAQQGYSDAQIRASIGRMTADMGRQGYTPAQVYHHLTGGSLDAPTGPSAGRRVMNSLVRGISLGFLGDRPAPDPYASTLGMILTDLMPEVIGGVAPFGVASGALKAAGLAPKIARALGVAREAETLAPAVTQGVTAGGVGAATEGVQQLRRGEFDPRALLLHTLVNSALGAGFGAWQAARPVPPIPEYMSGTRNAMRDLTARINRTPLPTSTPKPLSEPPGPYDEKVLNILGSLLGAGTVGATLYSLFRTHGGSEDVPSETQTETP